MMEIRCFRKGDERDIINLFQKVFGKPISESFWNWRYANNPFTSEIMISLMYDNENLVGHYAVSPLEMRFKNRKYLTAISMTTMTDPAYGGQGIFTSLAEHLYASLKSDFRVDMVWGFPNTNSHYGFIKKLSWANYCVIPTLSLRRGNLNTFKKCSYHLHTSFNQEHELTFEKYREGRLAINRTLKYLTWRYLENPTNTYYILESRVSEELAFIVFKVFDSFTVSGKKEIDILEHGYAAQLPTILHLLGGLSQFIEDQEIDLHQVNTWVPFNDERHLLFERMGFVLSEPVTMLGNRVLGELGSVGIAQNEWLYSMGDSDIF